MHSELFRYSEGGKRFIDLLLLLPALPAILSLMAGITICVRLKMGSPVLFRQMRPGRNGNLFTIYKFRTMTNKRDERGFLLPDHDRLIPFGRFLRNTSLDELPEFLNVIKGDMSIVGPRPLLRQYLSRYNPVQARRHEVKPGVTGWAQVNGRNAITWEKKFEYDVWYIQHLSFRFDLKIIVMTIWKILKREGINQPGKATAEEYKGMMGDL